VTTLFDATLALAKILTTVPEGTATGGGTTTLVDSSRTEPVDHFNDGTIWFKSGNNIGLSTKVTDYAANGTFTHATLGADVAAIIAAHNPRDVEDERRKKYNAAGVTIEAMIVALWEQVVEQRPAAAQELELLRQGVKNGK